MERIWSRLDMARAIGMPGLRQDYPVFVKLAARVLQHDQQKLDGSGYSQLLSALLKVGGTQALQQDNITFLTFNQDVALDQEICKVGVNCFSNDWAGFLRYWLGRWNEECQRYPPKLLKLHGSLNWGVCEDESCGSGVTTFAEFDQVPGVFASKACQYHGEDQSLRLVPLLVPPTWMKAPHGHELRRIWAQARAELRSAKLLLIVGHSWPETDAYFEHFLALSLRKEMQVVIVDPCNAEHYKQRLTKTSLVLAERVRTVNRRFGSAIEEIVTMVVATLNAA
jgi:hypothetical protein